MHGGKGTNKKRQAFAYGMDKQKILSMVKSSKKVCQYYKLCLGKILSFSEVFLACWLPIYRLFSNDLHMNSNN